MENIFDFRKYFDELKSSRDIYRSYFFYKSHIFDDGDDGLNHFFHTEHIKQILFENKLVDEPNNAAVYISPDFYKANKQIKGFALVRDNKVMYFENKPNEKNKLQIIGHFELSTELKQNLIMYEGYIGEKCRLFNSFGRNFFDEITHNKRSITDVLQDEKFFEKTKQKENDVKCKEIKEENSSQYDTIITAELKKIEIDTTIKNPDDDIVKKHIENYINVQHTLKAIHAVGGPTNTLLRMLYCCVDGVEIKPNLPIIQFNYSIKTSKLTDDENKKVLRRQYEKYMKVNRELTNAQIDKSLKIQH